MIEDLHEAGKAESLAWIQDLSPCHFGDEAAAVLKAVGWLDPWW